MKSNFLEHGIDAVLERQIKHFMLINAKNAANSTSLAEIAAEHFEHWEWLDDHTHPIWDWALDYFGDVS